MKYLYSHLSTVLKKLKGKPLFLFLDYDGTLTPIVESPNKAVISPETKKLLRNLLKTNKCRLVVISGRKLKDIKKLVGLRHIIYVGNHGFEIEGADFRFKYPMPSKYKKALKQIGSELRKKLSNIKGILIENKRYSVCLHYRLVKSSFIPKLRSCFHRLIARYLRQKVVVVYRGKAVLEVRPNLNWNKGKSVLWLFQQIRSIKENEFIYPVYIGDDVTDEDAFKILKTKGLTIYIGKPKKSYAKFYLYNSNEVSGFLKQVLEVVKNDSFISKAGSICW